MVDTIGMGTFETIEIGDYAYMITMVNGKYFISSLTEGEGDSMVIRHVGTADDRDSAVLSAERTRVLTADTHPASA